MKKLTLLFLILSLFAALLGCDNTIGEETIPPATSPAETTAPSTLPTQTTLPPETTTPPETTVPPETIDTTAVGDGVPQNCLLVTDNAPRMDIGASADIIAESVLESEGLLTAHYLYFPRSISKEKRITDNIFWFCTDDLEMMSGNHYQCYALEDGQLKKLQNVIFSNTLTVGDEKIPLEFHYCVYNGRVLPTYEAALADMDWHRRAKVVETSRGINQCLVQYVVAEDTEEWTLKCIGLDLLDLETGKLLNSIHNSETIAGAGIMGWKDSDNLIIYSNEDASYHLFNIHSGTLSAYDSYSKIPEGSLTYTFSEREEDALDPFSGEKLHTVVYKDLLVTDPNTGRIVRIDAPPEWANGFSKTYTNAGGEKFIWDSGLSDIYPSPDGRKLLMYNRSTEGQYQLLIYDGDSDRLIQIQRENPNGITDYLIYWTSNDSLAIISQDYQNVCIYNFTGK